MKKLFLGLIALTSLGSLQAADSSLTDTATFVLESGMKVAITITDNVEDTIVAALTAITAIAFARHYLLEYLDRKYLEAQRQQEQALIRDIHIILETDQDIPQNERAIFTTDLANAERRLQHWRTELQNIQ